MKSDEPRTRASRRTSSPQLQTIARSLTILALCALGTMLYLGHEVFIPVALALLFATVLSGTVEMLHRHHVPRSIAAFLPLLVLLMVIAGIFNAVAEPARQWFANLPHTLQVIERKVHPLEQGLNRLELLTSRAGAIASPNAINAHPDAAVAPQSSTSVSAWDVLSQTRAGVVSTVTVIILSLFLLSGGPPMLARMAASVADDLQAVRVLTVIDAIRSEVGRYYGTIALINLGLGIATGLIMMLLKVPNPFLWGTMAAVFNFVPYVGGAVTLLVLAIIALVSFDSVGHIIAVPGSYLVLATLEGQVVQPLLVGHRLDLNPLLVFLAIWFGGWMWGIAGIVIAIPSLVALKVAAEHSRGGHAVVAFLSPSNGKPFKLKQRRARSDGSDR